MEPKWQEHFITYGIPIAVFGMRFVFPIVMVSMASHIVIEDGGIGVALAYFSGIILHLILITFDELLNMNGVRSGIVGLLYLEILVETKREEGNYSSLFILT